MCASSVAGLRCSVGGVVSVTVLIVLWRCSVRGFLGAVW